jgi:hypothetical protein
VRFTDFLRATVLTSAGAASALAAATIVGINDEQNSTLAIAALAWWVAAGGCGAYLGRRGEATPPIARLLAGARLSPALPEQRPGRILLNRLWPLLMMTVAGGALAFLFPQIPMLAAGFAIVASLAWRRQDAAVAAIEDRDGVRFYVEPTSPLQPIRLLRTPGIHSQFPSPNGAGEADRAVRRGV